MSDTPGNKDKELTHQGHLSAERPKQAGIKKAKKELQRKEDAKKVQHQHQLFIMNYLATFNEAKAAKLSGLKPQEGRQLLDNPLIREQINVGVNTLFKKNGIEEDEIIKQLSKIAFEQFPEERGIKPSEQIAALKLLGQHKGMWVDQSEESVIQPPDITIIVTDKPRAEQKEVLEIEDHSHTKTK